MFNGRKRTIHLGMTSLISADIVTTVTNKVNVLLIPRFYVSTSKSIIKALINMHSFEIQLSPIG
ncbi:hypothetical protein EWN08_25140 [Salmonella enterica]|nr:hypothetical protein [Salmonella enterica]EAR6664029.1 hypothetical protein [Salmonella enterica]